MKASQLLLASAIWLVFSEDSYAYIDPGTGSFILQMLIAGVLGAIFYLKVYWQKVKLFVANRWRSAKVRFTDPEPDMQDGDDQTE